MSIAYLFPGQGSQHGGMLAACGFTTAGRHTLREAATTLDTSTESLDGAQRRGDSVAIQLALLTAGVAAARNLGEHGVLPDFVAGHSVGAFAAATVAETLAFSDALRLVRLRGTAMRDVYPSGYGMGVISGLDERSVAKLVRETSTASEPVYTSNVNAPRQIAVSGADAGLWRTLAAARRRGAWQAEHLAVTQPSHCELMVSIPGQLEEALRGVPAWPPRVPYISNIGARPLGDARAVCHDLAHQVAYPVRWHDTTVLLHELGTRLYIETGPGHVLTRLVSRTFPADRAVAVSEAAPGAVVRYAERERPVDR